MRKLLFLLFVVAAIPMANAQKGHYDSIRDQLRQDSIEYEQQLKDADYIKKQTDSIIRSQFGGLENMNSTADSAASLKKLEDYLLQQKKENEAAEIRQYYLFGGSVLLILIIIIVAVKRRQGLS